MDAFEVEIEGLTPLIMHNNNLEARDAIYSKGRQGGKAGDDRTPPDTWKSALYLDERGVCLPAENLLGALLKAGAKIGIGKMRTLKASSQALFFSEVYLRLLVNGKEISKSDIDAIKSDDFADHCAGARELGFVLFVKSVTVNGKSHVRVRPRFDRWSVRARFETDDEELIGKNKKGRVEDLWRGAGKQGVGDWRPSSPKKPGMYGMFSSSVERL